MAAQYALARFPADPSPLQASRLHLALSACAHRAAPGGCTRSSSTAIASLPTKTASRCAGARLTWAGRQERFTLWRWKLDLGAVNREVAHVVAAKAETHWPALEVT